MPWILARRFFYGNIDLTPNLTRWLIFARSASGLGIARGLRGGGVRRSRPLTPARTLASRGRPGLALPGYFLG